MWKMHSKGMSAEISLLTVMLFMSLCSIPLEAPPGSCCISFCSDDILRSFFGGGSLPGGDR